MPLVRCPVCDQPFDTAQSASPPFCGPRCRAVDLGRWLDEGYGLPFERDPELAELESDGESEVGKAADDDGEDYE